MNVAADADGHLVTARTYRLHVAADRPLATLEDPSGLRLGRFALLAAVDTTDGLDGAVEPARPRPAPADRGEPDDAATASSAIASFVVELPSTRWAAKRVVLRCFANRLEVHAEVEGDGALADVRLLAGRHPGDAGWGSGLQLSRIDARTLVSPNPEDPRRIATSPNEPTTIGVVGGGGLGRGHWFFTPAPLCLAFSPVAAADPAAVPAGPWLSVAVGAPLDALTFADLRYEPLDGAFGLRLAYDGRTTVSGTWRSPTVVVQPGATGPYAAIEAHGDWLVERGFAPAPRIAPPSPAAPAHDHAARPAWWSEPIFCGWGAQARLAALDGSRPADHATQAVYDRFLAELDERGIDPGTIVVDDRWERRYGTGEPDERRWPDLAAWIAARHRDGRRVLLWWKAWDPEGVDASLCVTTTSGYPVAVDPSNPAYRELLASRIRRLLAPPPGGLGADGLKIDFAARTPSGPGLRAHGPEWGIALLHRLLATIHDAAKSARPDAFVVAHAPHPAFADVADAVRLNDVLRLEDPDRDVPVVAQMRHRAAVARAACPGLLVETDDWGMPSRAAWREYLEAKPSLGIPSLYYTSHLDLTGEPLLDEDAAAIRGTWAAWRAANRLPVRPLAEPTRAAVGETARTPRTAAEVRR